MLNGSALIRVLVVVIAAAALTGLVQHYWTFDNGAPDAPTEITRPVPASAPARQSDPTPIQPAVPAPALSVPPQAAGPDAVALPGPRTTGPAPALPEPATVQPSPPPTSAAVEPESGEQEIAAAEAALPRAVDLVDLNTGSLTELNGLKGGGAIGRAIIQHRPYTSVDQLISKRVLSRAVYQRIKNQVAVR